MTATESPRKMPRGPYRNGLKRRREIVKAAALVFGSYGYQAGSLRAIAERVGTTAATLVAYFTNKEGLLVAVLEYWDEESNPITGLFRGLDHFRSFIKLMEYHTRHRGLIELFLTLSVEASRDDHPAHAFIAERQRQTLTDMIENLRVAEELKQILPMSEHTREVEARLLIATLDGIELQWTYDPSVDLVGIVRDSLDTSISRWSGRPRESVGRETMDWLA